MNDESISCSGGVNSHPSIVSWWAGGLQQRVACMPKSKERWNVDKGLETLESLSRNEKESITIFFLERPFIDGFFSAGQYGARLPFHQMSGSSFTP